jgi:nucleoside phosphorylase
MRDLTWAECRVAARSIREAEFGPEAVGEVRPRGVFGVLRARGPLSLLLYAAAREDRLVWRSPESLALLQPPGDKPRPAPDLRGTLAQKLVRGWEGWVILVPPVLALAIATLLGAATNAKGAALVLILGALLYVAVLMTCGVVSMLIGAVHGVREKTPEVTPGEGWSLVLCHHVETNARPRLLLREVSKRLDQLVGSTSAEPLTYVPRAVTTADLRRQVEEWSDRALPDHRSGRESLRIFDRGGFLFWYLGGVAVVVLVLATMVPGWERDACGTACAAHPATFGTALRWLGQRLLLSDPYGLSAAAWRTWVIGWLVSAMSFVGGLVLVASLRQYVRARDAERSRLREQRRLRNTRTRTLIIVVTPEERDAVIAATGREPHTDYLERQVVYRLGTVSRTELTLAQVEQGNVGPSSAGIAAVALINRIEPDFLILAGICYGLQPEWQRLGDVLVCDQLRAIDHRRQTGDRSINRGDSVTPSTALLSRFKAVARTRRRIHFGPMLSGSVLVDSLRLRDDLRDQHPEALGGEMEGAGVYAAAADARVDWIVVKAISDWGYERSDADRELAARNAAEFVVHAAEEQALDT